MALFWPFNKTLELFRGYAFRSNEYERYSDNQYDKRRDKNFANTFSEEMVAWYDGI